MKRFISLLMVGTMILFLSGCQSKAEDKNSTSKDVSIESTDSNKEEKSTLSVKIITSNSANSSSNLPMTLSPKVEGKISRDVQYHWILGNLNDFEGFSVSGKNGPQKEVINSGESVELSQFAMVDWKAGSVVEFTIKLQIEEKGTSNVIASDEIVIQNFQGVYNVKY